MASSLCRSKSHCPTTCERKNLYIYIYIESYLYIQIFHIHPDPQTNHTACNAFYRLFLLSFYPLATSPNPLSGTKHTQGPFWYFFQCRDAGNSRAFHRTGGHVGIRLDRNVATGEGWNHQVVKRNEIWIYLDGGEWKCTWFNWALFLGIVMIM